MKPVTLLAMQCAQCGAAVDAGRVFPGARVSCNCGAETVVSVRCAMASAGPYRSPGRPSFPDAAPSHRRERSRASSSFRRCPRCSIAMPAPLQAVEEEPSECERCHGMFVPWELLTVALSRAQAHVEGDGVWSRQSVLPDEVTYLRCPACGEAMNRTLYSPRSGLIVDVCSIDGLWFDAGEIERAVQFPVLNRPSMKRASAPSFPIIEPLMVRPAHRGFIDKLIALLFG